jgi:hypothetical protein
MCDTTYFVYRNRGLFCGTILGWVFTVAAVVAWVILSMYLQTSGREGIELPVKEYDHLQLTCSPP